MNKRLKLRLWHWIVLAVLVGFLFDWFIQRPDPMTRRLNAAIAEQGSEQLKNYPYPFRVLRVIGSKAVMGTPRSHEVPAIRFISVIHPELDVMDSNSPALIAAQKELAAAQWEARAIVQAQPGIESVAWEIDKRWLTSHGVDVPDR